MAVTSNASIDVCLCDRQATPERRRTGEHRRGEAAVRREVSLQPRDLHESRTRPVGLMGLDHDAAPVVELQPGHRSDARPVEQRVPDAGAERVTAKLVDRAGNDRGVVAAMNRELDVRRIPFGEVRGDRVLQVTAGHGTRETPEGRR